MSEYPWFSELVAKYWPDLEGMIPADEPIVFKFICLFEGLGSRVSGLCVVTDKTIYIRGKPKTGAFTPVWKLAGAKSVQSYPIDAIYEIVDKKTKLIFRIKHDYLGGKYIGKTGKFLLAPHQGKEKGIGKEPKAEWLKRIDDYRTFFASKITG